MLTFSSVYNFVNNNDRLGIRYMRSNVKSIRTFQWRCIHKYWHLKKIPLHEIYYRTEEETKFTYLSSNSNAITFSSSSNPSSPKMKRVTSLISSPSKKLLTSHQRSLSMRLARSRFGFSSNSDSLPSTSHNSPAKRNTGTTFHIPFVLGLYTG